MKFNSLSEMLDHFKTIEEMQKSIDSWLNKLRPHMTDREYCEHVIVNRDLLIYGFQLRDIDAFIEGYCYEKK